MAKLAMLALLAFPTVMQADDTIGTKPEQPRSRHSVDVGLSFLDSREFNSLTGLFSYTYNITPYSNFSVTVPYLDSDFGQQGGSGIGDTELVYTWSPNQDISANPWVPKTAGTGMALILPTGSANDGRSLDAAILLPFLGLVIPVSGHLFVYPGFQAAISVDSIAGGKEVRLGMARAGLTWIGDSGIWVGFEPVYVKDFEADATYLNLSAEAGKLFPSGFGFSFHYDDLERFLPGATPSEDAQYDRVVTINLHFVF